MELKRKKVLLAILCAFLPGTVEAAENQYTEPVTGMGFALIPGGCYSMGDSAGDGDPNERPVREVCVGDFLIGTHEVTNKQYKLFQPNHVSGSSQGASLDGDDLPVVNVSWEDARAFAQWLSTQSGATYRLPSEAEWEYAARAGSSHSRYWGNSVDDTCTYANVADLTAQQQWAKWTVFPCSDGYAAAAPVGSFKANDYGLYDMLGNVWEWCEDVFNSEAYEKLPKDNPLYTGSGEYRVMRGGGWSNGPLGVRSSHRVGLSPGFGHHSLGFRLVKSTP